MQYLRADAITQRSDEITMEYPNIVHGFSHRAYSDATAISVNQQKNIIQHPCWGKIFLFQNDYTYISLNKPSSFYVHQHLYHKPYLLLIYLLSNFKIFHSFCKLPKFKYYALLLVHVCQCTA